ncbi:hypothetical protein [Mycobacterium avium]|uniref:Uncharacterized protein n=1 Tax=Mycobacterium avium subsp. hominissuis TaxID=439334 RepID=A0AAI8X5D9_MYCAV|nr:hypothetical protein [Mycobacterium avium]PBA08623.1 hypothetical protein CKJ70_25180 [Mycobacterium avium]BBN50850.1 hypothetical protein JPH1_53250 [Mycobacterium avium subsp. hominissuis]
MASDFATQVKLACDDLYCDPLDHTARTRVRELLSTDAGDDPQVLTRSYVRRIRIACDELHDCPTDVDAQLALLHLVSYGPAPLAATGS